jgi:predicted TIM-barrel fold metal-dependent hydrolase
MFTQPPLLACIQVFGLDRVMVSVDYPYSGNEQGRKFLDECSLPPVDMAKFCHGTADALLKLKA